jgi:putative cell wall-binding protein
MKNFYLLAALTFSLISEAAILKPASNDKQTAEALSKCKSAVRIIEAEIPDTVACPKVLKYSFKEATSAAELSKIVEAELKYNLQAKVSDWDKIISESFELQTGFAAETLSEGSGQYADKVEKKIRKAISDADSAIAVLSKNLVLKGTALGSKVYVDTETTWGSKINAKAIIILNAPRKTVEVYLHGDLDG